MKRNFLIERHPHLRNTWIDLSKLLGLCKNLLNEKGIIIEDGIKDEEWTNYIKNNYKILWDKCTELGWVTKIPPIQSHDNFHVQLYIDGISMISNTESMINYITEMK